MPEYNFPISLPTFTDEEFERERNEYVEENGWHVTVPKLTDVIHFRPRSEPDQAEWDTYVSSDMARADPNRHRAISQLLDAKRAKRDRMLASPMPTWGKNIASVLTTFDDINDTLGTAGVLMRVAARLLPRTLGRLMLGPVGWLFLLADIAGLFLDIMRLPLVCYKKKKLYERVRGLNPFSKKSRVLRARRMRRLGVGKGEWIELLQTTDNIFGVGLCLGPILGFAYDVVAGTVRMIMGQEVHWHSPPPRRPKWVHPSEKLLRDSPVLHGAGEEMSDDDHLAFYVALNGATQVMKPYIDAWHPLDQVVNFDAVLFQAPRPHHPTTKFVLEEIGIKEGQGIGWPGLDKDLVTWEELWDHTQPRAARRFMDYAIRNRQNYKGLVGCQNGDEFGMNMLSILEGYETVWYDSDSTWKGYGDYFATGCDLVGCGGMSMGGVNPLFAKRHGIPMGKKWLIVGGSSLPHRVLKGHAAGQWLHCQNCKMYIGTGMAPGGFHGHITEAWTTDEAGYLELVRRRQIT